MNNKELIELMKRQLDQQQAQLMLQREQLEQQSKESKRKLNYKVVKMKCKSKLF